MPIFSLHQPFVRLIARLGWAALLTLALAACDNYPEVTLQCSEWNGRTELRPLLDGTDREVAYCVFADGTECHLRQLYYGTCTPPGASAPLSPVPTPNGGFGGTSLESGFDDVAPPPSLDALVGQAALVFTGEIGLVKQYIEIAGYSAAGQLVLPGTDADGNPLPGLPATDFLLTVEQVIRDDGSIARGEPIILRMPGYITAAMKQPSQAGEYPVSYTGDRYLFLLSPYPDGQTYGFYFGPWSRLIMNGNELRVSNGKQQPFQFGEGDEPITLDEFIRYVQTRTSSEASALISPLATPISTRASQEGGFVPAAPETLAELVSRAPLIMIGTVGPEPQYTSIVPYREGQPVTDDADVGNKSCPRQPHARPPRFPAGF